MDIHSLTFFKKAADLQHITKAAEELHVAQPSLSRTIAHLEKELGVRLFERTGKNIYLNQYGAILLRHTNRILQEMQDIEKEIHDALEDTPSTVTLSLYAASKMLPGLFTAFQKEYPSIRLKISQHGIFGAPHEESDLSISSSSQPASAPNTVTLFEEEILLAVPKRHPISSAPSVDLRQAADLEFICLQPGRSLRSITDTLCQLAGFKPHVILETDSPETVRSLIEAGIGVAFIPAITWSELKTSSISLLHISVPQHCRRFINLSWRTSGYLSPAAILFRGFIQDYFKAIIDRANHPTPVSPAAGPDTDGGPAVNPDTGGSPAVGPDTGGSSAVGYGSGSDTGSVPMISEDHIGHQS